MKVNIGRYPKNNTERKISIKIDKWDTWSADHTLALIIAPLLVQLKEVKHGAPKVDDCDVPEYLHSTVAPAKENDWDVDDNWFKRWDYVMDEMIFAMQQLSSDNIDDAFYDHSEVDENQNIMQQINKIKVDVDGLEAHHARIQKGCELFGKYFQGLWD